MIVESPRPEEVIKLALMAGLRCSLIVGGGQRDTVKIYGVDCNLVSNLIAGSEHLLVTDVGLYHVQAKERSVPKKEEAVVSAVPRPVARTGRSVRR